MNSEIGNAGQRTMRTARLLHATGDWICARPVRVLSLCLISSVGLVLWQVSELSHNLIQESARQGAISYSDSLTAFRTLYSSEVVSQAKSHGMEVCHDYENRSNAIPLPATLSMKLGELIGKKEHGATARLFSDHPFPWRTTGGPHDEFEQAAMVALRRQPEQPFYRFDQVDGRDVLRYATADRMRESCVSCHNSHAESPKTDWRVGDVRGVLAVSVPLETSVNLVQSGLRGSSMLMAGLSALGVFGVGLILRRHRRDAERMARANQLLASQKADLAQAKCALEVMNGASQQRTAVLKKTQLAALNMMKDAEYARRNLEQSNVELIDEITERIGLQGELEDLRQEHLDVARRAGMEEVATGVLHNVGNVLNSVNVSTDIMRDRIRGSRIDNLQKVVELFDEHQADIGRFLTTDERGRRIPAYLHRVVNSLSEDRSFLQDELGKLDDSVDHIMEIVQVQQSFACRGGGLEEVDLAELVESAIRVNEPSIGRNNIEITRDFDVVPKVPTEKHKVLQILVNLISNAKNAIVEHDCSSRRLSIRLVMTDQDVVRVVVKDSGIGIAAENLDRIFNHGFTTRDKGHGFGLHSSANAAAELGSTLGVSSEGIGHGAVFTLQIPVQEDAKCQTTC